MYSSDPWYSQKSHEQPKKKYTAPFDRCRSTPGRFPNLEALCQAPHESQIVKGQPLRGPLKRFAKSRRTIVGLILRSLETLRGSDEEHAATMSSKDQMQIEKTFPTPEEYPSDVNQRFHAILNQPSLWKCSTSHLHHGRLRLREGILVQDEDVLFDTAFSVQTGDDSIRWQQLRFHVPRYAYEKKYS